MKPGNDLYILNEHGVPVREPDMYKWAEWYGKPDRLIHQEWVEESRISTVFLGIDHNWSGEGPPILWETMVFNGKLNGQMDRCSGTREQAEAMHAEMVARVFDAEHESQNH
jgi:hypothetical protein